jgi:hypothetical protein
MPTWMAFGILTFAVVFIVSVWLGLTRRPALSAVGAAFLNVIFAGMNSSAPFRGALDSRYVGYRFGLLAVAPGWRVFAVAGIVMLASTAAAITALAIRNGRPLLLVAVVDSLLLLNIVTGLGIEATAGRDFEIAFGEYIRIPSPIGLVLQVAVLIVPLAFTIVWALRQSREQILSTH